jgi:hypothetical protein
MAAVRSPRGGRSPRGRPAHHEASRLFGLFALRREQGRLTELEEELHKAAAQFPGYRVVRCMFLVMLCDSGRLDEAAALFDQLAAGDFARSRRTWSGWRL